MEVIRFDGYTMAEKTAIARGYLWPRQRERNGLLEDEVKVSDEILTQVAQEYTREAGVRNLERELGTILRKTATRIASGKARRRSRSRRRSSVTRWAVRRSSRRRRCARPSPVWPRASR